MLEMDISEDSSSSDVPGFFIKEYKPQKTIVYNKYLPYAADLNDEIVQQLAEIKENLSRAVLLRDIRPGCSYWTARLGRFIRLYGMCFSKEDHILFIKLLYELVIIPNQEFIVTEKFAQILTLLLKKRELVSPDDVQLDWKPLYEAFYNLFFSSTRQLGMILLPLNAEYTIKMVIRSCQPYFTLNTTAELLEKWRPYLCPFDQSMNKAIGILEIFMPTLVAPENSDKGWKLWLDEFLNIWNTFTNEPSWLPSLFCLFARLAWHNIGYIDWEKHLPSIFTRILRKFNLPVTYKKVQISTRSGINNWSVAWFIVANLGGGSKAQDHLDQLFKALESYYHPSNVGTWTMTLQDFLLKLSQYFVQRLHHERHKKPSWNAPIPEWKKLTDEDIARFVNCLLPATKLAIFSKVGSFDAGTVMHRLSLLCPEIVIPPLLEQLYMSLETMTEPHRLTASLHCVVRVARPLVLGGSSFPGQKQKYPEGPTHVMPLLMMALPGIDPNDINKCMTTFQFIATFTSLVPLIDCSSAVDHLTDLTEIEQQVCLQTAGFGDFVMQFMDKCFALIESCSLEQTTQLDRETESMNLEENMVELGLFSAFKIILTQSHPKIFDDALERLVMFTKGRCMETRVSGKLISTMCRAAAKVDPEKTLKAFIPSLSRLILTLTESPEIQEEENLDNEILFNLLLISELVQSKGRFLVKYLPVLTEVLKQTLHLKSRKGYKMASSILRNLLWSLSLLYSNDIKSSTHSWEANFSEFLPIKHWGEAGNLDSLGMSWSEPGEEEENALVFLVNEFLIPELQILQKVTDGDTTISRERFHQSLIITQDVLFAGGVLPLWDEKPIKLIEMSVERGSCDLKTSSHQMKIELDSPGFPKNVRQAVAETVLKLVESLLEKGSDDTKALNYIVSIYFSLIFFHGIKREEYEEVLRNFHRVKHSLADSVVRKKQHIRALLIERVVLQHERRVLLKGVSEFTPMHEKILRSLWSLSISHYSEVRRKSQAALSKVFQQFNCSYKLILPDIIEVLGKDSKLFHKEIKGTLFVTLSFKKKSLIVRRDWETLNVIWPALLSSEYSEKPSVIKLYDCLLRVLGSYFELFAIDIKVPDKALTCAKELLSSPRPSANCSAFDASEEEEAIRQLELKVRENTSNYKSLVHKIVNLVETRNLHWRRRQLALTMLWFLVRPDIPFPVQGVKTVISNLINDNIILRKIALNCMTWIFKNQKRCHKKLTFKSSELCGDDLSSEIQPGDNRPDNKWLQYKHSSLHLTEEEWEKPRFIHKTYHGWYCWPKEMEVYAPPKDQPPLDRPYESLSEEEQAVFDFFSRKENVDAFISFLSLEENKGMDKFETKNFLLYKGLFRNFGDTFLPLFEPHLERLVSDSIESNQRCAAELLAGMIRGSKHWPYKKAKYALDLACRVISVVFSKVMNETIHDWGSCFNNICRDRDPNRLAPLIELFYEKLSTQEEGSFLFSSRLHLAHVFLEQQEWRVAESFHKLYEILKPHFSSPYKSIRDNVGSLLYVMFVHDQNLPKGVKTQAPLPSSFVDYLLPRLSIIIQEAGSGSGALEITPSYSGETPPADSSFGASSLMATDPSLAIEMSVARALQSFDQSSSRPESPKELQELSMRSLTGKGLQDISLGDAVPLSETLALSPLYSNVNAVKLRLGSVQGSASGNVYTPGESEERKTALKLMNTLCKYLKDVAYYGIYSFPKDVFNFLPHLCQLESVNSDQELRSNCIISIACLSTSFVLTENIGFVIQILQTICQTGWWRAKIAALAIVQMMIFHNMFTAIESGVLSTAKDIVLSAVSDPRTEVRQMASQVLSGFFHCNLILPDASLLAQFTNWMNTGKRQRRRETGLLKNLSPTDITTRHSGALGLCAYVNAHPYDVPDEMPQVLISLTEHIGDPQPVSNDIKECLRDFHRTHHDNWQEQKKKFTSDQIVALTDVLVSPSYYA